jgi:beta-lactamase class C
MLKRLFAGICVLIIMMFSSRDLGSITGGIAESKHAVFHRDYKPGGIDSLFFSFDDYLRHAVDTFQSPGAAVAIVYKGEIVLLRGYGTKKVGESDSVDIHTAFRIGSVSKGFASVLTGILVNEGILSWDDHVKKYLNDFTMKDTSCASQLTVKHLLSHTSGFPAHTYTDLLDHGYSYENIKHSLGTVPLAAKPGQIYGYQNVVYSLIGDILQKATGLDYNSLLRQRIFEPLEMNEASTDFNTFNNAPNTAFPHLQAGKTWKARSKNERYYSASPASGINASASDMAQWLLALTGNYPEVIPQKTIQDISKACIEIPRKYTYRANWKSLEKTYYGLGWRIFRVQNHEIIYHGGYVEGFRSEIAFDSDEDIGIAILFNSNTSVASHCVPYFFEHFYSLKSGPSALPHLADN